MHAKHRLHAKHIKNFSDWRNERAKVILGEGNPETMDKHT